MITLCSRFLILLLKTFFKNSFQFTAVWGEDTVVSCIPPVLTYAWLPALSGSLPSETGLKTEEPRWRTTLLPKLSLCSLMPSRIMETVLHELQRSSLIALSGQGGHIKLMPSRLCVPFGAGSEVLQCSRSHMWSAQGHSSNWLVVR